MKSTRTTIAGPRRAAILAVAWLLLAAASAPSVLAQEETESPSPSPSPSPCETPLPTTPSAPTTPAPTPTPCPSPSPTPTVTPKPKPTPKPTKTPPPPPDDKDGRPDEDGGDGTGRPEAPDTEKEKRRERRRLRNAEVPDLTYRTDKLVRASLLLRSLGWSSARTNAAFVPFILAGEAAWTDTWGAARYGPGDLQRTHEGQDVFCDYGAPVLAVERGYVEFDEQLLGGKIARLHTRGGDYWYYAHLARPNRELSSGDRVAPGDVIGFCGNTGNAISTPPHVHFGHYLADGEAVDAMDDLVGWLEEAEHDARNLVRTSLLEYSRNVDERTSLRRFGGGFVPQASDELPPLPTSSVARIITQIFLGDGDEELEL